MSIVLAHLGTLGRCWGKPMTDGRRFSATAIKAHTFISTHYSNPSTSVDPSVAMGA
jgi:hypothetical protein